MEEKKSAGFRLTDRDVAILGFLMDQKFASLEQIYFRFFDVRASNLDPLPPGLHVTRQRIQVLMRGGLVSSQRVFSESKSLYLLTQFGHQVLESRRPEDVFAPATRDIDFRNYEHDTKINDCRIAIERAGKVVKWIPERRIRMNGFASQHSAYKLPKEIVPDGVFISSKGERIAFEIETTHRKKSRYEAKRDGYLSVMGGDNPLIHRVIWVGFTDKILKDLRQVNRNHEEFIIDSYGHFASKLWPKSLAEVLS
jgi:hypothetical protein